MSAMDEIVTIADWPGLARIVTDWICDGISIQNDGNIVPIRCNILSLFPFEDGGQSGIIDHNVASLPIGRSISTRRCAG
jgi:hypothetical protein